MATGILIVFSKALAKLSQHANTTYRNIVERNTVAKRPQYVGCCWLKFDHFQIWTNMLQHIATQHVVLTCCNRVAEA